MLSQCENKAHPQTYGVVTYGGVRRDEGTRMKIASLTPKQWATGQLVQIKPKLRGWLHLAAAPL